MDVYTRVDEIMVKANARKSNFLEEERGYFDAVQALERELSYNPDNDYVRKYLADCLDKYAGYFLPNNENDHVERFKVCKGKYDALKRAIEIDRKCGKDTVSNRRLPQMIRLAVIACANASWVADPVILQASVDMLHHVEYCEILENELKDPMDIKYFRAIPNMLTSGYAHLAFYYMNEQHRNPVKAFNCICQALKYMKKEEICVCDSNPKNPDCKDVLFTRSELEKNKQTIIKLFDKNSSG